MTVEAIKEEYRAERGLLLIDNVLQDVRFAMRSLRRTPGLTAFVVLTLGLGIGMTSGTFSMMDALVFRLPILLCHLEGLTYEQAAQQLGCPVRTVQSRLARAHQRLRDRLARRGVGPQLRHLQRRLLRRPPDRERRPRRQ